MNSKKLPSKKDVGLVPLEDHYDVFKEIEAEFKDQLAQQEHDYLMIGLRVAYDVLESSTSEPGEFPYSVEFGYLEEFDKKSPDRLEVNEEELTAAFNRSPIPNEMLEKVYAFAKEKLEAAAGTPLAVGIHLEYKTLMSVQSLGIGCSCRNVKGKKWKKAPGSGVWGCRAGC